MISYQTSVRFFRGIKITLYDLLPKPSRHTLKLTAHMPQFQQKPLLKSTPVPRNLLNKTSERGHEKLNLPSCYENVNITFCSGVSEVSTTLLPCAATSTAKKHLPVMNLVLERLIPPLFLTSETLLMSQNPRSCKTSSASRNTTLPLLPAAKEFTHSIKMSSQVFFRAFATQSVVLHLFCPKNVEGKK